MLNSKKCCFQIQVDARTRGTDSVKDRSKRSNYESLGIFGSRLRFSADLQSVFLLETLFRSRMNPTKARGRLPRSLGDWPRWHSWLCSTSHRTISHVHGAGLRFMQRIQTSRTLLLVCGLATNGYKNLKYHD